MDTNDSKNEEQIIRISEKVILSLSEATAYSGIGRHKLARLSNEPGCNFVLYVGSKRFYKRKQLEEFLLSSKTI